MFPLVRSRYAETLRLHFLPLFLSPAFSLLCTRRVGRIKINIENYIKYSFAFQPATRSRVSLRGLSRRVESSRFRHSAIDKLAYPRRDCREDPRPARSKTTCLLDISRTSLRLARALHLQEI